MSAAVTVENVHKVYNKVPVVNDLSFTIEPGEMFGLLGPNGAGKSTFVRQITGVDLPVDGGWAAL